MLSHSIAFDRVEEGLNSGSGFGTEKAKTKTSAGSVEETKNTLLDEEDECAKVENEDRNPSEMVSGYSDAYSDTRWVFGWLASGYTPGLRSLRPPAWFAVGSVWRGEYGIFPGHEQINGFVDKCREEVDHGLFWYFEGGGPEFNMDRGKGAATDTSGGMREFCKWTEDMDAKLLHSMIEENRLGNRIDGSWTTQAYNNMVQFLHNAGYVYVTKANVKNRQKVLKDRWREAHDLFSGLSGFAWNSVTMRFEAEDESRPAASKWRVTSIRHYDLMVELWASDRATGSGVRTARQTRRRLTPRVSVDLNQNIEYISEQPDWTTYRDPTPALPPPFVDEYSPGNTQSVPSVPSGGTSSSRGSKRKAPLVDVVDAHFSALRSSLDGFTDVLTSSNVHLGVISNAVVEQVSTMKDRNEILHSQTEILRRTPNYTYTEADIYDMLSGMQISDETLLEQCYDFLCANPTCVKRLMGLPPHKRWNKLCKIYSGGN
ncbi:uncharacterized protein HKW66_Vig0005990 [Vigna angularis]|uniref:Myb/SANT-like domain-containing protein n=1 Tax=Phaseolus angularis TaxID=3914 RepID=A0A8T0LD89_PHAAN|nr:uncharacterized protein HKW66_Vig0005990 [Vigna angularis]